jgi:nitrate reductase NapE component
MILEQEVKPSLESLIEHHGVLGMKWGKTRAKATAREIQTARVKIQAQALDVNNKKVDARKEKDPAVAAALKKEAGEMKTAFLKNPDRVIAARMTRGEKAVFLILGSVAVTPVVSVAAVGTTSLISRRIEQNQATGKYDKKK